MTADLDTAQPFPPLSQRFSEAFGWAHSLHASQVRKGTTIPYVSHLMAVAGLVIEHGGTEDQAIAALLHDSIEDQDIPDAEIENRFGAAVSLMVRACTDAYERPKPPWAARKRRYIEHLATAPADALLVSLADKTHNARCIAADVRRVGNAYLDIFNAKVDGTRWYYRRLHDAFSLRQEDLPPEMRDSKPVRGGKSLLLDLEEAITMFGADEAAAQAFEAANPDAAV